MPLPQQSPFEDLLQSIVPVRPDDTAGLLVEQILPSTPARDQTGLFTEMERHIWYRPQPALTFDALVDRVQKELRDKRHKTDRSLALCMIGLFAIGTRRDDSAVSAFNRITATIDDCDLSQFFVTPGKCDDKISTFRLGLLL
jgi:hypothetical protein